MTIEEKRRALMRYCGESGSCEDCKAVTDGYGRCWTGSDEHMLANYDRVFSSLSDENPYWERICELANRQRSKGISKYGKGLEDNPAAMSARITHLQEELIDGLMYCEWIKDKLMELEGEKHD